MKNKTLEDQPYRIEGVDPPRKWRIEVQHRTCRTVEYYSKDEIDTFRRIFSEE